MEPKPSGQVTLRFRHLDQALTSSILQEVVGLPEAGLIEQKQSIGGHLLLVINTENIALAANVCAKICTRRAYVPNEDTSYFYAEQSTIKSLLSELSTRALSNAKVAIDSLIGKLDTVYRS